jgi:hypothetical protein
MSGNDVGQLAAYCVRKSIFASAREIVQGLVVGKTTDFEPANLRLSSDKNRQKLPWIASHTRARTVRENPSAMPRSVFRLTG